MYDAVPGAVGSRDRGHGRLGSLDTLSLAQRQRARRAAAQQRREAKELLKREERRLKEQTKQMRQEDKRNPVPDIKVMLLGFRQSGKTVQLGATNFAMSVGDESVRLQAYPRTLVGLGSMVSNLIGETPGLPPGNILGKVAEWDFRVQAAGENPNRWQTISRLRYVDYAGEHGTDVFKAHSVPENSPNAYGANTLLSAVQTYDIVMAVLDGAKVAQLMMGHPPADFEAELFQMMALWSQGAQGFGQVVLTKYDLLQDYGLRAVVDRLDTYESFSRLRDVSPAKPIRLIPVSAFGLNGYLTMTQNGVARDPNKQWHPLNPTMPLACAFADIVARDIQRLEAEGTAASKFIKIATSPLTRLVLAGLGLAAAHHAIPLVAVRHVTSARHPFKRNMNLGSALEAVRALMREGSHNIHSDRPGGQNFLRTFVGLPNRSNPEVQAAMAHTVAYCARQAARLERQFPECVLSQRSEK
jgi:hypothetical protein